MPCKDKKENLQRNYNDKKNMHAKDIFFIIAATGSKLHLQTHFSAAIYDAMQVLPQYP